MKQNIRWSRGRWGFDLEPRLNGDCADVGEWEGHWYHIFQLRSGRWYADRVYDNELKVLTPIGGVATGTEAWAECRHDTVIRTLWLLRREAS
jgi:hypothetical protein